MSSYHSEENGSIGGAGGIFGPQGADDELHEAMLRGIEHRADGTWVNHAGELRARRAQRAAREEMFVVQRAIDEIPDLLRWAKQTARDKAVFAVARTVGMNTDHTLDLYVSEGHESLTGGAIASNVSRRLRDGVTDFVAKILYRAYMRDQIERDRAFSTLRGIDADDAAVTFADRIATSIVGKILRVAGMADPPPPTTDSPAMDDQTP